MESITSITRHVWFTGGLILAPMVRLNTTPFRLLCLKHGADVVFTEELISFKLLKCRRFENATLKTIDFISDKNELVLRIAEEERTKLILQIGANDPEVALKAAQIVQDDVIGVDVNMGCPKHFSTHGNMGSNLLYIPDLATSILTKLRTNLKGDKFVSCKIRLLDSDEATTKFINTIQNTGIDFFSVHFRTKHQTAKDKSDWSKLPLIQKIAKVPFFANGDIFNYNDYLIVKQCKYHIQCNILSK
jgi:tRNA-dihydrouridine synthase 2